MQRTDMSIDEKTILQYLMNMRNQRTNTTAVTKQFLEKLTGKQEWTTEQCQQFFESFLRYYIEDENDLDHMLAVSGLKDDYREPKLSAAKRRERYVEFLHKNSLTKVEVSALEKREKKLLSEQIAPKLKADIDSGKIDKLLSEWILGTGTNLTPKKASLLQRIKQSLNRPFFKQKPTNTAKQPPTLHEWLDIWFYPKDSQNRNSNITKTDRDSKILTPIITVCLLFAVLIVAIAMHYNYKMAHMAVSGEDISSVSGTDADKDTSVDSVDGLERHAQNRIVNIDEPEEYDVEAIRESIMIRIIKNPAYGDMVARGLRDIKLRSGKTIGDYNPWLVELVEKTDEAMSLPPNQHPRGLERWLEYHKGEGNTLFVTDEYFYDALRLSVLLVDRLTLVGVREWESSENWIIDPSWGSSDYRAEKNSSQVTCPALILQGSETGDSIDFIIGFSLEDGRLLIYDPEQVTQ